MGWLGPFIAGIAVGAALVGLICMAIEHYENRGRPSRRYFD